MNLLFIFTDQQNRYALGCMDNPNVDTPHLDRLAGRGVLFRRCYSNAPVCSPFRGTLLTGQYISRCGVLKNGHPVPAGVATFADAFNDAGCATSWVGKWHLGGSGNGPIARDLQGGFQRFMGYQCYNGFYRFVCFYDREGNERRFDRHRTDVTTDLAIEDLKRLSRDERPFMLMIAYQAPHSPSSRRRSTLNSTETARSSAGRTARTSIRSRRPSLRPAPDRSRPIPITSVTATTWTSTSASTTPCARRSTPTSAASSRRSSSSASPAIQ